MNEYNFFFLLKLHHYETLTSHLGRLFKAINHMSSYVNAIKEKKNTNTWLTNQTHVKRKNNAPRKQINQI